MELYHKEIITKAWIRVNTKIMPVTCELGKAGRGDFEILEKFKWSMKNYEIRI